MRHPYSQLTPDVVMDALESVGLYSDYRLYPLNSYENRVYQVGIEDASPVIAKFYRPSRWSEAQIQEEHDALMLLSTSGVSVAAPRILEGKSLFTYNDFYFSVTDKLAGEAPEAGNLDQLYRIGELIGEMHLATEQLTLNARKPVTVTERISRARDLVLSSGHLPKAMQAEYVALVEQLSTCSQKTLDAYNKPMRFVHGDCHRSNLLDYHGQLTLLDFDDCRMGHAIQDLWLHISDKDQKQQQLSELIEGYESILPFDTRELDLIDAYMAERHIVYTGWIAERWHDPAFPTIFPHFSSEGFWQQHLKDLRDIAQEWGKWR